MKLRALAVAAILIMLTVIKVTCPNIVAGISKTFVQGANHAGELAAYALSLGRRISGDEGTIYAWETEREEAKAQEEAEIPEKSSRSNLEKPVIEDLEGFVLDDMIYANLSGFDGYDVSTRIPTESANVSEYTLTAAVAVPEKSELELRMEAFMVAQAAVTDMALPENVCVDAIAIDIDHAPPVTAPTTSVFGYRIHPIYNDIRFHYGTDFQVYNGDPIGAFAAGTVIAAQEFSGYGNTVIIDHGNGITSLYAHCSSIAVSYGEAVTKGQIIGRVGSTGNVTGPHLHFELKKDNKYINPEFYL